MRQWHPRLGTSTDEAIRILILIVAPDSRNRNGPLIFSMWMRPRREKKRANALKRNVSFAPDIVAKVFFG